ncbi:hypothetical protein E2C01_079739 [Portunus trituberculatus]|uniref:Uncharacterized protein n=1 Tax=Portunus trituberculatus TaxID=210409 RepID=A0A5B7IM93_PORTR|nr:hypothetical protein [Portunus trituberculatus]
MQAVDRQGERHQREEVISRLSTQSTPYVGVYMCAAMHERCKGPVSISIRLNLVIVYTFYANPGSPGDKPERRLHRGTAPRGRCLQVEGLLTG